MNSYRIPKPRIIYEVLNSEVIVIDFDTGNYYALPHIASQVWQMIEKGISLDQMASLIAAHYQMEVGSVAKDVEKFTRQLAKIGLLEASDPAPSSPLSFPINPHGWPYEAPWMQEYTDVQNLLLLDPIHEVTEEGWPETAESRLS